VALNAVVSVIALLVAQATKYVGATEESEVGVATTAWPIYLSFALSGMTALACEVIWTRRVCLLFGATVYTFSLVLAVFLIGIALAAVASRGQDPARLVGGVYAANTVGAIVGSLGASLIFVVWMGSQHAQQALIAISALSALLASGSTAFGTESGAKLSKYSLLVSVLIVAGYAELAIAAVHPLPARLVEYGRFAAIRGAANKTVYVGEGLTASVAVSDLPDGIRNYHNAGKVQASSDPADMRLQRMLGH